MVKTTIQHHLPAKITVDSGGESRTDDGSSIDANNGFLSSFFFTFFGLRLVTPLSSSIIRKIWAWSEESTGATEMSLTARKLPQLFICSFSNRKKFHTNRLKTMKQN